MFRLEQIVLHGSEHNRLDGICLHLGGKNTAVLGCSGSGKTSLLNLLAGYEQPDAGTLTIEKRPAEEAPAHAGLPLFWVPQDGGLWGHLDVRSHLQICGPAQGRTQSGDDEDWRQLAAEFRLDHRLDAYPAELSAGECSRLSLARALASRADVLLLDEPLSHVDPIHRASYWNVLRRRTAACGTRVIFSSHEPVEVLRTAERVICLDGGRVIYSGEVMELYRNPPAAEPGRLLGPLNWFEEMERQRLYAAGSSLPADRGIRPEQLAVKSLSGLTAPGLELLRTDCCGLYHASQLRDEAGWEIEVLHGAMGDIPPSGNRVRVVIAGEQADCVAAGRSGERLS